MRVVIAAVDREAAVGDDQRRISADEWVRLRDL